MIETLLKPYDDSLNFPHHVTPLSRQLILNLINSMSEPYKDLSFLSVHS